MPLNSIEVEWQGFAAMIFKGMEPPPHRQISEMKKAFFAGAAAMIANFNEIADPSVSEAQSVAYIQARVDESQQFYNKVMADYAEGN